LGRVLRDGEGAGDGFGFMVGRESGEVGVGVFGCEFCYGHFSSRFYFYGFVVGRGGMLGGKAEYKDEARLASGDGLGRNARHELRGPWNLEH
jgi:hypothetical protein